MVSTHCLCVYLCVLSHKELKLSSPKLVKRWTKVSLYRCDFGTESHRFWKWVDEVALSDCMCSKMTFLFFETLVPCDISSFPVFLCIQHISTLRLNSVSMTSPAFHVMFPMFQIVNLGAFPFSLPSVQVLFILVVHVSCQSSAKWLARKASSMKLLACQGDYLHKDRLKNEWYIMLCILALCP